MSLIPDTPVANWATPALCSVAIGVTKWLFGYWLVPAQNQGSLDDTSAEGKVFRDKRDLCWVSRLTNFVSRKIDDRKQGGNYWYIQCIQNLVNEIN